MKQKKDIKKVLIIGSGPIIIGQACEFDYSGTQACKALRKLGYEIVLVNSNPATIMTDPEIADATYIEPLNINRLEQIFREVYAKAKQKDPSLNSSIQLYITDDDSPNAFATGRKTVCVTRGLLNMPDEQIRATLGHEFGHLAHKDTDLILLISVGNMFVNMLVTFFNIGLWLFDIITTIMCLFKGGEDGFITHLFMIFSRFLAVITVNLLLRIWTGLGTLLVMKSSRGNEFEADEFAFQLGYGDQLCALLDYFSTHEQKASGLFAALASSHPDSHDRIARLQQLGAGYYR